MKSLSKNEPQIYGQKIEYQNKKQKGLTNAKPFKNS